MQRGRVALCGASAPLENGQNQYVEIFEKHPSPPDLA